MGIYITLGIVFALFIGAAYIAARLDDKLNKKEKLAEILPLKSADMSYRASYRENGVISGYQATLCPFTLASWIAVPCWSFAALLNVLPKYELYNFGNTIQLDVNKEALATEGDETLLDLVVNMIIHLHEQELI